MARVFKHTYTKNINGKRVSKKTRKYYVEYRDAQDILRRRPGYTDRKATEQLASELERQAAREHSGLVDRYAEHRKRPLLEHADDYEEHLRDSGCTNHHAKTVVPRIRKVLIGCSLAFWPDLSASRVQRFVAQLRKDGRSVQTCNFYLQAAKQFCRWMVQDGRAPDNPLEHLKGGNVQTDRRHDRRAFTDDELRALLRTTRNSPTRCKMTGAERALLYVLAVETGLRAGEIRSLTPRSFNTEGEPPTVTVGAAYSKHRREDVQPLRSEFAQVMADYLRDHNPDAPVFNVPEKTAKMLRADLTDARSAWVDDAGMDRAERNRRVRTSFLEYRDESGRVVDFHAFRHTFITNLARGGVHPKQAQDLARHSDINLTMSRYSHTVMADRAAALDALPDLTTTRLEQERKRATGTDGNSLVSGLVERRTPKGSPMASDGNNVEPDHDDRSRVNPDGTDTYDSDRPEQSSSDKLRRSGLEPLTFGSVDRCSIQLS